MSIDFSMGGRAPVDFPFYAGQAGVGAIDQAGEVTIAIPVKSVRGAYDNAGSVDGQPVEIVRIEKSPVAGYTRVVVRILSA